MPFFALSSPGSNPRVPDAVQRISRCTAEPGPTPAICEVWTPDQQRIVKDAALHPGNDELHHHAQPFCRTRNAGVEPPCSALLERKTLIEQHHVVPLRALRLVNREHIAVVELVIGLALLPGIVSIAPPEPAPR